jgi:chemotaxis protein methyltransferase CheR
VSGLAAGMDRSGALAAPAGPWRGSFQISDAAFRAIKSWLHSTAGISLSDQKRGMVAGRLAQRLRHFGLGSYDAYLRLLREGAHPAEPQIAIDLLTTNETHFFREAAHFDALRAHALSARRPGRIFRVWSAASSSGEEPYSIAMTLADCLGDAHWEVLASDLSARVLERARSGHYAMARSETIPRRYLLEYCLKGVGEQDGTFIVAPDIRARVQFTQINLVKKLPHIGSFDAVFVRNVMIYFDAPTKRDLVARLAAVVKHDGLLFTGHSESLYGFSGDFDLLRPSIYHKRA